MLAGATELSDGHRSLGFGCKPYYFAQHQVEALNLKQTVLQEADDIGAEVTHTKLRGALGAFLFTEDDIDKRVAVLSGGEKARLSLVKMLLTPSNLLLLDEPTNHLDMASRAVLGEALSAFTGTIILISHDRHFLDEVCNEVWEIAEGRITPFLGNYSEYLERAARGERPEPLPLHQPRRPKAPKRKSELPQQAAVTKAKPTPKPTQAEPEAIQWSSTPGVRVRKSKEQKREQAEQRRLLASQRRVFAANYAAAEREVGELEETLQGLQEIQADPTHYEAPEQVKIVAQQVSQLEEQLSAAYARWEEAGAALEAFDEQNAL